VATVLVVLAQATALAACGGSSQGTPSGAASTPASSGLRAASASAASSGHASAHGHAKQRTSGGSGAQTGAAGVAMLRECLRKAGVKLTGHSLTSSGRAQDRAALEKCEGGRSRSGAASARVELAPPARAYAKFIACMEKHGVRLPPPNTSGAGPVFTGPASAGKRARAAELRCVSTLPSLRARQPSPKPQGQSRNPG